jgi:hypothetical protein
VYKKCLLTAAVVAGVVFQSYCQSDSLKKVNQYVGIQANQLFRQLFNFGGTSTPINNPYLLTYSLNSANTGWGFAVGLGYTHSQFEEGDLFNPVETTINDFFFRIGVDRKTLIGKRWLLGFGFDLIRESLKNETKSNSFFGDFKSETKSSVFGFGPRMGLNFLITPRILVGTEATYYFKRTKETQKVTDLNTQTERFRDFSLLVPAVLYLNVKF